MFCDSCKKTRLNVYYHCEDCIDYCENCWATEPKNGQIFVKRFRALEISIAAQPEDIESYITRRIEVEEDLLNVLKRHSHLQAKILDTVIENTQGMFLLVRFHMDTLADCLSVAEVEEALRHLPQGINDTYDQAMARIEKLSSNRRRAVKRLLLWTSYAERPLTVQELEHAIAVSRGVREINPEHLISPRVLTSLSEGLVIVDENENVHLTHKTAEDYFSHRRAALFGDGETEIAESCLAYLRLLALESGPCTGPDESRAFDARVKQCPFYGYAAQYWGEHARRCNSEIVTPQALLFLRNKQLLEASVQALWYTDTVSADSWDVPGGVDALHIVAFFGLSDILAGLLSDGADPNVRDSLGTPPLVYACAKARIDVFDALLAAGAAAHLIDDRGSTALHRCVKLGQVELTRRLVQEKDVAINAPCMSFNSYTALIIACSAKHLELVEILLARPDIDVNLAPPQADCNPLISAALAGAEDCMEALLSHPKIHKDHQDVSGYSAIHYAAMCGEIGCLKALLRHGADPNLQDDQGGRPLQRAIDDGQLEAVSVLLQHRVEWSFTDHLGRTIFHAAAINDRAQILQLLLETCRDVDIDAQGHDGDTALHDAARCGFLATTSVLLESGARTDVENGSGQTPVRMAMDAGSKNVLGMLQDARTKEFKLGSNSRRKADTFEIKAELPLVNTVKQDSIESLRDRISRSSAKELDESGMGFNGTPIHVACALPSVEKAALLLEAGAFVDPMDSFSRTPLTIACQIGDLSLVRLLVKHGADVNMAKFGLKAPWELALESEGYVAANFLLALPQTWINPSSTQRTLALEWAAALGNLEACKRLIEAGASVQRKNGNGMTAVQIAKAWGEVEVEKYLFEEAKKQMAVSQAESSQIYDLDREKGSVSETAIGQPPRTLPTSKKDEGRQHFVWLLSWPIMAVTLCVIGFSFALPYLKYIRH